MSPVRLSVSAPRTLLAALALMAASSVATAQENNSELARAAYDVLVKNCYECHQPGNEFGDLDVTSRDLLFRKLNEKGKPVTPFIDLEKKDDPKASKLLEVVIGENPKMPQGGRLSAADVKILVDWVAAGAPEYVAPTKERPFVSQAEILRSMQKFLLDPKKVQIGRQQFRVFFSLAHIYNNRRISDLDVRLYRAALSKALNSLSRSNRVIVPDEVDANGTVYSVDLQQFGWMKSNNDLTLWKKVVAEYPYGFKPDGRNVQAEADALAVLRDNKLLGPVNQGIPFLHADWFVAFVTRSDAEPASADQPAGAKLYYELLDIPLKIEDLEKRLGVTRDSDIKEGVVKRGGVIISGVSAQNRLVDLHRPSSSQGGYWISYDFSRNNGKGNIVRFPLGPNFEGNPFNDFAFEHAGGEIIYRLPNGLNGYVLIDTKGNRIDKGPIDIVRDLNQASGTPEIVNGLSCMTCHGHGMVKFKEVVGDGLALAGTALARANQVYFGQNDLDQELEADSAAYLVALEKAIGPFVKVNENAQTEITKFPEPVGFVARQYSKDLSATEAALELGFEKPDDFISAISNSDVLENLGLAPLTKGRSVKRSYWASREADGSPFQQAIKGLKRGIPISVPRVAPPAAAAN